MRAANILTCISALAWFGMFLVGLEGTNGVINQRVPGYPAKGQIDFYIVRPAITVMIVLASAWVLNSLRRWPWLLVFISAGSLLALFPFLLVYTGGV